MRIRLASLLLLSACAPQFRADVIAHTQFAAAAPGTPMAATVAVQEQGLVHRLRYHIDFPRAMELKYAMTCPSVTREGVVGETFEAYKTRRLAEIERAQKDKAALVGGIVGAVAPKAKVEGDVKTPDAEGHVEGTVDPGKGAEQAALAAQGQAELPAGDVGEQSRSGVIEFVSVAPGACTFELRSEIAEQDPTGVHVDLTLEKLTDLRAERRAKDAAAKKIAVQVRVDLSASLTAHGADPGKWARDHAAAEAERARQRKIRLDAQEAARQAKAQAYWAREEERRKHRDLVAGWASAGIHLRGELVVRLEGHGADPGKHDRERAEADAERARRVQIRLQEQEVARQAKAQRDWARQEEQRRRWEIQAQAAQAGLHLRGELVVRLQADGADPGLRAREQQEEMQRWQAEQAQLAEQRRQAEEELRAELEASLEIRGEVKEHLQLMGAVDRPPRPADQIETPPAAPFDNAVWIGGEWSWDGAQWVWITGHYEEAPARDVVYVPAVHVEVHGSITVTSPGRWVKMKGGVVRRDHSH